MHAVLLENAQPLSEWTPLSISTIADTWMHVSYLSQSGERNRALTIIKSRGTGHSNQVRELVLVDAVAVGRRDAVDGGAVGLDHAECVLCEVHVPIRLPA